MGSLVCKCNEEGKDKEVDFIQEKNQFVDLLTENISLKRELNQIQNKYVVYTILIYQLNDLGAGENTPNQVGEHLKKLDSSNNIEPLNSNFSNNSFIRKVQSYSKSKSSLNVIPSKRKSEFQNKRELEDLNSRIKLDGIERVTSPNSSFEIITGNIMKVNLQSNNTSLALNLKSNKDSKINACLLKNNNNQLNLDTEIIYSLDSDCVIYDIEMNKIKLFKNDLKVTERYCQLTRDHFKYFNSMYSSTVWLDKPLMRLPLENICKLHIGRNSDRKLKDNFNIEMILHVHFKFNELFHYNPNYEVVTYTNRKGEVINILEFGIKEEEDLLNLIKIISFLKKVK